MCCCSLAHHAPINPQYPLHTHTHTCAPRTVLFPALCCCPPNLPFPYPISLFPQSPQTPRCPFAPAPEHCAAAAELVGVPVPRRVPGAPQQASPAPATAVHRLPPAGPVQLGCGDRRPATLARVAGAGMGICIASLDAHPCCEVCTCGMMARCGEGRGGSERSLANSHTCVLPQVCVLALALACVWYV